MYLNNRIPARFLQEVSDAEVDRVLDRIHARMKFCGGFLTPVYLADELRIDRKIVWGWLTGKRSRNKGSRNLIDSRPRIPHEIIPCKNQRDSKSSGKTFRKIGPADDVKDWLAAYARETLALVALRERAEKAPFTARVAL